MTKSRQADEFEFHLPASQTRARRGSFLICHKLPIILLLITLTGLATVAKDGQYYHGSNSEHRVSLSTKMNVAQAPVALSPSSFQRVGTVFASKPPATTRIRIRYTPLPVQPVALRLSIRHRSPPAITVL